jgi:hypothetical protein
MWKENDLSDLTYALCEGNIAFKQFFIDFFFGQGTIDASSAKIIREKFFDGSRPDFWIQVNGVNYIVEVKIWDGSHHFKQYLPFIDNNPNRLGYIAAYNVVADADGSPVNRSIYPGLRTWKELILALSSEVKEEGLGIGDAAIIGYMKYVRSVCGIGEEYADITIIDAKPMKILSDITSCVINAVEWCKNKGVCEFYGKSPTNSDYTWRKGIFFQFEHDGVMAYGFIGLYFGKAKESPFIVIEFDNAPGWGECVCKSLNVKDEKLQFFPDETIATDSVLLGAFLEDVIAKIREHNIEGISREKQYLLSFKELKSIQLFDRKLRMELLNFEDNAFGYTVKYYANNRTWPGAVGEYFEIKFADKDVTWGWVGITFANGKVSAVLRFRSDWPGPFREKEDILLWDGVGSLDLDGFLIRLKNELNKLAEMK